MTLGVSFGMTGRCVALRTAATTASVPTRLHPNWMPPSLMFGHEMFSSMAATPSASVSTLVTSTYSSMVVPQTLTKTRGAALAEQRQLLLDEAMHADALQADRVDHAGGRLDDARRRRGPSRSVMNRPLTQTPPSDDEVGHLVVLEAVAEAAARRDERDWAGAATRSGRRDHGASSIPDDVGRVEDGAVDARTDEVRLGRRRAAP